MSYLHVVYRVHDEGLPTEDWATYSFPDGIYVSGTTLAEARSEFHEAAEDLLGADEYDEVVILEHIERPMLEGAYVRVAVDRRMLDRQEVADVMRGSLVDGQPGNRVDLEGRLPVSASGDVVVVACVPADTVRWVLDQMAPEDVLGVCMPGPIAPGGRLVAWSWLIREGADLTSDERANAESLLDARLTAESSISELIRADSSENARGHLVAAV